MKNISTILSTISLAIAGSLGVGAYVTYEKAKAILDNPEAFVTEIVKEQIKAKTTAKIQAKKERDPKEALKSNFLSNFSDV
jgi:hypothetical protein